MNPSLGRLITYTNNFFEVIPHSTGYSIYLTQRSSNNVKEKADATFVINGDWTNVKMAYIYLPLDNSMAFSGDCYVT